MSLSFKDVRKQVGTLEVAERFFDSLLMFALFDLGVFSALCDGPRTLDELHASVGGDADTLRALLDAGVATTLLTRDGASRYAARDEFVACLGDPSRPAYLGEWIVFLRALVPHVALLAEAVRTGRPSGSMVAGGDGDDRPARAMTRAMDAYARTRGAELAWQLDFTGVRRLLDVGCGPGSYSLAIVERHPDVHATLLDLPGPIEVAREVVAARGLGERVTLVAADALAWAADEPFDVVLVSNILHMLGPSTSRRLLAHLHDLVAPGGRLLVQAEFLDAERTSPRWPTLLNLIMQVTTDGGRNHAVDETSDWMRAAGFTEVEHARLSPFNVNSVLVGRRGAQEPRP